MRVEQLRLIIAYRFRGVCLVRRDRGLGIPVSVEINPFVEKDPLAKVIQKLVHVARGPQVHRRQKMFVEFYLDSLFALIAKVVMINFYHIRSKFRFKKIKKYFVLI
jgi:hypothetical protein